MLSSGGSLSHWTPEGFFSRHLGLRGPKNLSAPEDSREGTGSGGHQGTGGRLKDLSLIPLQSRGLVPALLVTQPWVPSDDRCCLYPEPGVPLRMPGPVFLQCQAGVPGGWDRGPCSHPLHGHFKRPPVSPCWVPGCQRKRMSGFPPGQRRP